MTLDEPHVMTVVKQYPTGTLLLMCPICGLTMVKDLSSGAFVVLEWGPHGCVPVNHYFHIGQDAQETVDEMDVWRRALEDIEL